MGKVSYVTDEIGKVSYVTDEKWVKFHSLQMKTG